MSRVLLTRPEPAASRTARDLIRRGYQPVVAPMMRMRAIGLAALPEVPEGAAVAVTSARAIEAVAGSPGWERLRGLPVFAVGGATGAGSAASCTTDSGAVCSAMSQPYASAQQALCLLRLGAVRCGAR